MPDHTLHTVAADAVIIAPGGDGTPHVLVIQRRWDPYEGCWALPGGHVDAGEPTEAAARRELAEETGVTAPTGLRPVGVFDAPGRDPRGHVISVAYTAVLPAMVEPTAADDARDARWVPVDQLLASPSALAFDHAQILAAAVHLHRTRTVVHGVRPSLVEYRVGDVADFLATQPRDRRVVVPCDIDGMCYAMLGVIGETLFEQDCPWGGERMFSPEEIAASPTPDDWSQPSAAAERVVLFGPVDADVRDIAAREAGGGSL